MGSSSLVILISNMINRGINSQSPGKLTVLFPLKISSLVYLILPSTTDCRIVESVGEGVTEFKEGDHVLTLFTGEFSSFSEYTVVHSGCAVKVTSTAPLEKICLLSCGVAAGLSLEGEICRRLDAIDGGLSYRRGFISWTVTADELPGNIHAFTLFASFWGIFGTASIYLCRVYIWSTNSFCSVCLRILVCDCTLTTENLLLGLGAAWKVADISAGSTVVIFGLGTVGLSVAQGAKLRKASRIIGVDTNPEKSEKAKAFGITDFLNPNECDEPIQQVIKRITDGGADYSFECIGDTTMITTALQSCCDGWGLTVTLGVPKVKPEITAHYSLFLTGKTLRGSLFGGWKPKSDLPLLVDMYVRE
ncbi:unnamed protein product, partial [Ilex paraguariensis]